MFFKQLRMAQYVSASYVAWGFDMRRLHTQKTHMTTVIQTDNRRKKDEPIYKHTLTRASNTYTHTWSRNLSTIHIAVSTWLERCSGHVRHFTVRRPCELFLGIATVPRRTYEFVIRRIFRCRRSSLRAANRDEAALTKSPECVCCCVRTSKRSKLGQSCSADRDMRVGSKS